MPSVLYVLTCDTFTFFPYRLGSKHSTHGELSLSLAIDLFELQSWYTVLWWCNSKGLVWPCQIIRDSLPWPVDCYCSQSLITFKLTNHLNDRTFNGWVTKADTSIQLCGTPAMPALWVYTWLNCPDPSRFAIPLLAMPGLQVNTWPCQGCSSSVLIELSWSFLACSAISGPCQDWK